MPFKKKHGHGFTYAALFFMFGIPLILVLIGLIASCRTSATGTVCQPTAIQFHAGAQLAILSFGFGSLLLFIALIIRAVKS